MIQGFHKCRFPLHMDTYIGTYIHRYIHKIKDLQSFPDKKNLILLEV